MADCCLRVCQLRTQDDLKDVASLSASRTGIAMQQSYDQLRSTVVREAAVQDIVLEPEQITVQRFDSGGEQTVFLAAACRAQVWLPALLLILYFRATSA